MLESATLVRLWRDPPTLDPHLAGDATSGAIIVEVFGGLVTIDPDLQIVPDLAETWDVLDGGRSYIFHLRKDGKFHDGKSVTAHDFKWSLERAADPDTRSPVADTYLGDIVGAREKLLGTANTVVGVQVIDDFTLKVNIDAPKAYFIAKLTYPTAFVLDRANVEADPRWFLSPNGSGPFRLTEYLPGQVLVLNRNENYHLGPPKLEEVRFHLGGGDPLTMYLNDELHVVDIGPASPAAILDPLNPLSDQLRKFALRFSVGYMGMDVDTPPFDDVKVRLALNLAIDRELISQAILQGALPPAGSILPPGFPGHNPALKGYEYDPEKARRLLEESKYGGDLENFPPIVLTIPGSVGSRAGPDTEAILDMWSKNLGIEVKVQLTDWGTYLRDLDRQRFHMFGGLSWIADYPDPENFLDIHFHSGSGGNQTGYSNPSVDRILEQARVLQDQEARYELYHRAEEAILEDAPWILLWHSGIEYALVKPYVRDYFLTPMTVPVLRHVYMTEK